MAHTLQIQRFADIQVGHRRKFAICELPGAALVNVRNSTRAKAQQNLYKIPIDKQQALTGKPIRKQATYGTLFGNGNELLNIAHAAKGVQQVVATLEIFVWLQLSDVVLD